MPVAVFGGGLRVLLLEASERVLLTFILEQQL